MTEDSDEEKTATTPVAEVRNGSSGKKDESMVVKPMGNPRDQAGAGRIRKETARKTFGLNFREQRERLGLTQRDIAMALEIQQPYIVLVEAGNTNLNIDRMEKLAEAVDTPLHLLLRPRR